MCMCKYNTYPLNTVEACGVLKLVEQAADIGSDSKHLKLLILLVRLLLDSLHQSQHFGQIIPAFLSPLKCL